MDADKPLRSNPPVTCGPLDALRQANLTFCLLRDSIDPSDETGDIDLLVSSPDFHEAQAVLRALNFLPRAGAPIPHKLAFERYREGRWLAIDLHEQVVQYGLVYMDADLALRRRVRRSEGDRLSPEDELIHLVAHHALRVGPLRTGARDRILELLAGPIDQEALDQQVDRFHLRPDLERAIEWIRDGDPSPGAKDRVRRSFRRTLLLSSAANRLGDLRYRLRGFMRPWRSGQLIAIVGADGSGKSTTISALRERVSRIPGLAIRTVYLGPWGQMSTPWVSRVRKLGIVPSFEPWGRWLSARLAGRPLPASSPRESSLPLLELAGKWIRSELKGFLFYATLELELWFRYLRHVVPALLRGTCVVSDRYVTDLRFLYKGDRMENYAFLRWLACAMFPRPRLFVLLEQPPTLIHARKNSLSVDQISNFQELYRRAIAGRQCLRFREDFPPETIADRILEAALEARAGRTVGSPMSPGH